MSDEIWSRQFYKALEAVGKLTEVEKIRLANILIAVSDVKEVKKVLRYKDEQTILQEQKRILDIQRKVGTGHYAPEGKVPEFVPPPPRPPENKKVKW